MIVFVCRDDFYSILCGIYDAWMSRGGHENVRLETQEEENEETLWLFAEYREVQEASWKAEKVAEAVRKKISHEAYTWIYRAAMSCERGKADKIYRFLVKGFKVGRRIADMLNDPDVESVFSMNRQVANEAHLLTGFLRFSQMRQDLLVSVIGPKNDVTGILADHFSDRMPEERWMIYDEKRDKAALHEPGRSFLLVTGIPGRWREHLSLETDEAEFESLWRAFHQSISIAQRENYKCQITHLPMRFRPYMTEFGRGDSEKLSAPGKRAEGKK